MSNPELTNRFRFHPANTPERISHHGIVRDRCGDLAQQLDEVIPAGREKALALTKLEEVMFWANAGIARAAL